MRRRYQLIILLILLVLFPLLGKINASWADEAGPYHNSRDTLYRNPFGAVTVSTEVTLRLRTPTDSADSVTLRVFDLNANAQQLFQMVKSTTADNADFWEYTFKTPDQPTLLYYRFILRQGDKATFYEDDTRDDAGNYHWERKGGTGIALTESKDQGWQITVYTPDFTTPQWVHDAVIYQIFPDRFRNGDKSNDPADGSKTFYGNLTLHFHKTWNEKVEDPRSDPGGQFNRDFYGGDLKGIREKLPYLKDLGVTVLYLNPIFEAASNHRYDTVDYLKIDPILGTMDDWNALVKAANAQGIQIILDGVFNHVSSDSLFFDRYHHFDTAGACEDVNSKYRSWFTFRTPTKQDAVPNACVDDGKGDTAYNSWAGFDTLPQLNSSNILVRRYIYGSDNSVARTWIANGASGWRLDVPGVIDDGSPSNPYWEEFRREVKRANPNAVIIGEIWDDVSRWVTGTQFDSTMNYRLRNAIMPFTILQPFRDGDVNWQPLKPSQFDALVMAELEDYPPQAMDAMMNVLGTHDSSRMEYVFGGDKQSQQFAAFLDFMLPGAPTIYYGDEIALKSDDVQDQDDPYNRAPYPWPDESGNAYGPPDQNMYTFYQKLAQIRAAHPSLRDGTYQTLLVDDQAGVYAFLRITNGDTAVVVTNRSQADQSVTLNVQGVLPDGAVTDALSGANATIKDGKLTVTAKARVGAVYTLSQGTVTAANTDILKAAASDGKVMLSWPVRNALVKYDVYRSNFPTGAFTKLNDKPLDDTGSYTDTAVTNGTRYYYYVNVLDEKGLLQQKSGVVAAGPGAPIKSAQLLPPSGTQTISAPLSIKGLTLNASASIDSTQKQNVMAQATISAPNTDPKTLTDWQPMTAAADGTYSVAVRPAKGGDYQAVARFSTDGGLTWTYTAPLPVTVTAPNSTTPPATPANVQVAKSALFNVTLAWDAVPGAAAYRVYKGIGRNRVMIAETANTSYRDTDAVEGQTYYYIVTAIDSSLNESEASPQIEVAVKRQMVAVTFHVTVPADTPPKPPVYIAGDFGSKDYPLWNPGGLQMTDKGNNVWEITLNLQEGTPIQYKYVRETWDAVEKSPSCAEIANRTVTVKQGMAPIEDAVAKWRDIGKCG